jgi:endoglucanase
MMQRLLGRALLAALIGFGLTIVAGAGPAASRPAFHARSAATCSDAQFPATRDSANPLALPQSPGADPLHGAHLFVDGPAHGAAAQGIEQLLKVSPARYADSYSWNKFAQSLAPGGYLHAKITGHAALARQVARLSKIASQPETNNVSEFAGGGGPGAIVGQVQKLLCGNLTADPDPHPVAVFSTAFVAPRGKSCPSAAALRRNDSTFKRQIGELVQGTGRHPVVYLVEINSIVGSGCLSKAARAIWDADLRYEIVKLTALPHTVVYLSAGSSDELTPGVTAGLIGGVCVVKGRNACTGLRGFFSNDTHFNWSSHEIAWATKVSHTLGTLIKRQTHTKYVAHFIVNTAQNGRGPKLNRHPAKQGVENLCNPPGRGLGRIPTTDTAPTFDGHRFALLDAFLWTGVPGRSHASNCHRGDAPGGVFFDRFALELAANANQKLGPGFKSQPY